MKLSSTIAVCLFAMSAAGRPTAADVYKLEAADSLPKGLNDELMKALSGTGHRIVNSEGDLCDIWFAKSLSEKEGFKPDLRVKYPMQVGALVGVLEVKKGAEFTDFRDQEILPGLYTLRYGQQPQDGNHVGTSELRDFLLALPVKEDESAQTLSDEEELQELSSDAAGSSHPAIFPLLPPEQQEARSSLIHDDRHDLWILQTSVGEEQPVTLRLVVVGIGEE